LRAFGDPDVNALIEAAWGRVRDGSPERQAVIRTMRLQLDEGRSSARHGGKVFDQHCARCHKFDGRGHDVGPNLDGASRDLEYLLINVLDPNRVVGQPYYLRFVALKDGRVETGLLAGEDAQSLTLKNENDVLKVIPRDDVESVSEQAKSLMPEGLEKTMSLGDFRDLLRYLMADPFLTDVAVAGPFRTEATPPYRPNNDAVLWRRPVVGPTGRIPLPPTLTDAVALVKAEVTAPGVMSTRLELGAAHPLSVSLNGQVVFEGTPGRIYPAPDQASVEVGLRAGVNQIVLRVIYQGDKEVLYARLRDPRRLLQLPESAAP
jgi:putative heme-binding domain-containing protein